MDGNYYFISDDYNARMKFMTLTAAGEVDFCIIPKNELENYLDSEMFACLDDIMETRELEKYGLNVYRTPSDKKAWGINVSSLINSTLGYDAGNDYYAACVVNSKHEEQFAAFVDFILSNQRFL